MNCPRFLGHALLLFTFLQLAGCGAAPVRRPLALQPPPPRPAAPAAAPVTTVPLPLPLPSGDRRSVEDVLALYGPTAEQQLQPRFQRAGVAYPPRELMLVAYKAERVLELWARDQGEFRLIREYPILAASGTAGPKLRQGDLQVPEGIYRIDGLNPNSRFHLSMRINYPNEFDWDRAEEDGRDHLGSDIFIHGKDLSVGCVAIGDAAIEELFVLVAQTGAERAGVVIAPHDPRLVPLRADQEWLPEWTPELYAAIDRELRRLAPPPSAAAAAPPRMP